MAKYVEVSTIACHFESLADPRHTRNRKHLLSDVLVICVAAAITGASGPTSIHRWAKFHREWLSQHLALANGLPSRDCVRRVLIAVKPKAFQECFQNWIATGVKEDPDSKVRKLIAIDGKTCRRSHDAAKDLGALHVVSAWASEEGIALGQVATEEKSNEITAIPELLSQLNLEKSIVTIDAIACQKEIVKQIKKAKGDCVIAVKGNQPKLHDAIRSFFEGQLERDFEDLEYRCHETRDEGHGRVDERSYYIAKVPADFAPAKEWPEVKAIGCAVRMTTASDGSESCEFRYYICTRYLTGKRFAEAVRGHWAIESMHWVLDVVFREDESRARERALANNLSWLRRFATSILKRDPEKDSIRGKMLACGYSTKKLEQVLQL